MYVWVCVDDACCPLPPPPSSAPHPAMQVPPSQHKPGTVVHTMGYPLGHETYGGGFIYHMADNKVWGGGGRRGQGGVWVRVRGGGGRPERRHSREVWGGMSGNYGEVQAISSASQPVSRLPPSVMPSSSPFSSPAGGTGTCHRARLQQPQSEYAQGEQKENCGVFGLTASLMLPRDPLPVLSFHA